MPQAKKKPSHTPHHPTRLRQFCYWWLLPAAIYFVFFAIFTFPWIAHFSNHFMLDGGDGLQNVWNIWWVHKAIIGLHQNPYFTNYLHYPEGISLVPQTLNIFNGLVGIPLQALGLSLIQTVNTMVIFSFVMGGVTMFWLTKYLTKSYVIGLVGGFLFTFSSYHFAHAIGHLQLVSLEWIPLFLLAWLVLLERPTYLKAVLASLALTLVVSCDYYYFFYSVIAAVVLLGWKLLRHEIKLTRHNLEIFGLFGLVCLVIIGPLVGALLWLNHHDPLAGFHPAINLGMDLLAPFLPGAVWKWGWLTKWYWMRPTTIPAETSVYLGLSTLIPLAASVIYRHKNRLGEAITVWWIILGGFFLMSLGPRLWFDGSLHKHIKLPYAVAAKLFPPLQISGVPVRMVVMVGISAIIITCLTLAKTIKHQETLHLVCALLIGVATIELFPNHLPLTPPAYPPYVLAIQALPAGSTIIDDAADTAPDALFYQTIHQKPMAFGYVTRTTQSVDSRDFLIFADIEQNRQNLICPDFHIRYLATRHNYKNHFPIIYQAHDITNIHIYDLKDSPGC